MRILLIAYEFPPIIAAQSLRWFFLTTELAKLGIEVHVLCADMPALPPFHAELAPGVTEHRVWPGPYVGFSQTAHRFLLGRANSASTVSQQGSESNWLRIHRWGRRLLDQIIFPDLRSEWAPSASLRLIQLLRATKFSAIVASHEPGIDLALGLLAKRIARIPLVIDLADPVVAPYTPRWRQRLDLAFEAKVLSKADATVVTTMAVVELLRSRHGLRNGDGRFTCIEQGFPHVDRAISKKPSSFLHLVYTGSFYADFRSPVEFASAMRSLRDLNISVGLYGNHSAYQSIFNGISNVDFHGIVDHNQCISAQQNGDLLMSIGNKQSIQVPGKIYEYLGMGTPILHLSTSPIDEAGALIKRLRAGWVVKNEAASIEAALREIHARWRDGSLPTMLLRDEGAIAEHAWSQRALRYKAVIEESIETFDERTR